MTELINLNKRASLDKLSRLSGAVLAARVGVVAPATRSALRISQVASTTVVSSAVVLTRDADAFPLFAIWLAGVGLFGLGVSASRFWNAMSSQSTSDW